MCWMHLHLSEAVFPLAIKAQRLARTCKSAAIFPTSRESFAAPHLRT